MTEDAEPTVKRRTHQPSDAWLTWGLCALAATGLAAFYYNATLEDAHITYRYARHFGEGYGLGAWNKDGDQIEGYTTLLWMILLGALGKFGLSPFLVSKALGWLSHLAIVGAFVLAHRRGGRDGRAEAAGLPPEALLLAAMIAALYLPAAWYAVTGMETAFFTALITLLLLAPLIVAGPVALTVALAGLSTALVLTRPEGLVFGAAINGFWLALGVVRGGPRFPPLVGGLATGLAVAGITLYRLLYFGDLVPNTYYAKATGGLSHLVWGLDYVLGFLAATAPAILLVLVAVVLHGPRVVRSGLLVFSVAVLTVFTAYVIKVGGDNRAVFPFWRHYLHLLPFWSLLLAAAASLLAGRTWQRWCIALLMIAMIDLQIVRRGQAMLVAEPLRSIERHGLLTSEPANPYFVWLAGLTDEETLSAVALGGQWPYHVPGHYIDILGLSDRHIAKFGRYARNGPVDSKTDMAYVLARHPDLIDGYVSGQALLAGRCPGSGGLAEMVDDLRADPTFRSSYAFVANAPYAHLDRALFVSQAFAEGAAAAEMELVPVAETALYRVCPPAPTPGQATGADPSSTQ